MKKIIPFLAIALIIGGCKMDSTEEGFYIKNGSNSSFTYGSETIEAGKCSSGPIKGTPDFSRLDLHSETQTAVDSGTWYYKDGDGYKVYNIKEKDTYIYKITVSYKKSFSYYDGKNAVQTVTYTDPGDGSALSTTIELTGRYAKNVWTWKDGETYTPGTDETTDTLVVFTGAAETAVVSPASFAVETDSEKSKYTTLIKTSTYKYTFNYTITY